MTPEGKFMLISLGLILTGGIIKNENRSIGNSIQGAGIGIVTGTLGHLSPLGNNEKIPHHDLVAITSLPVIYAIDKLNIIGNKDVLDYAYGMSFGTLTQHLLTEGCSFCGTSYCKNGEDIC